MSLSSLLRPRSVAIIGASADKTKLTGRPLAYLTKYGFSGEIYPVNPRVDVIDGHRCYPDIAALPKPPDVAIVLLGGSRVTDAVRELAAIGTSSAIVLASGFGESGPEGRARQNALRQAAGSMRVLGPNTIGLVNVTEQIVLSASNALVGDEIIGGKVALVSQSGGILGALLSRAAAAGLGFSKLIATGNECDLEVADFVDLLAGDEATQVIALYLEGLRQPKAFQAAVERVHAAGKSVVAFKVGRSEAGVRSAVSHTGAMAGSNAAYDAMFRQWGVIRADRFSDLLDIPLILGSGRRLQGRRLGIVTSTGGSASVLADAAGVVGFETPPPDAKTAVELNALNIEGATLDRNPIDVTLAGVKSETLDKVLKAVASSHSYDAIAVVLGSSALREPETVSVPLRAVASESEKPIVGFASPHAPNLVRELNLVGIPTFAAPESCASALLALYRNGQMKALTLPELETAVPVSDDIRQMLRGGALNEAESKALFARFGIPTTREIVAQTPAEARRAALGLADRVVVKVLSRHLLHKSDAGGVVVGVSPENVAATCERMAVQVTDATQHSLEGFLVQELVSGGVEMILGFHHDASLGPVILLGMGGIAAELTEDVSLRLAPVSVSEAHSMIDELKTAALLKGFRGRPVADIDALATAIAAFSTMVHSIGHLLVEAEINPLFVLPQGLGVVAADGLVIVGNTPESAIDAGTGVSVR